MNYGTNTNSVPNITTWSDRAYTGHEQISELSGLVHMNARVYDNRIGRFLSADTMIPTPSDTRCYNRYSYVKNNPLKYTDPTGHWSLSKFVKRVTKSVKKHWRTVATAAIVAVLTVYTGGAALGALGYGSAAGTTIAAGASVSGLTAIVLSGAAAGFVGGLAGGAFKWSLR